MSTSLPFKPARLLYDQHPVLRFTPYAWAKLHFLCHHGDTEIGGFGIAVHDDLLLVEDVQTVKQVTSSVTVEFDDESVGDFFERQVDEGRQPSQFARIWIHTHPGDSPNPSSTDEETFARVFGKCDWAVMFILARGGKTYARLRFTAGPGGSLLIPVRVDYDQPFAQSNAELWEHEYDTHVHPEEFLTGGLMDPDLWEDEWLNELDQDLEAEFIEELEQRSSTELR